MHDSMHALFVDGVFNCLLFLLLESVIQIGYPVVYEVFSKYIAAWKWPARVLWRHLHRISSEDRKKKHRDAGRIK